MTNLGRDGLRMFLIVVFFAILAFVFWDSPEKIFFLKKNSVSSSADIRKNWSAMFDNLGPEKTMLEIKDSYKSVRDQSARHNAGHILGELLYSKYGLSALAYCHEAFNDGCFHGYFSSAISEEGTADILTELESSCKNAKNWAMKIGCIHGIGHGLVMGTGYEKDSLTASLKSCNELTLMRDTCYDGVFMEYNLHIMQHSENIYVGEVRVPDADPYSPCTEVDEIYATRCYEQLTLYWAWPSQYRKSLDDIALLCSQLLAPNHRFFCFGGIGKRVAMTNEGNWSEASRTATSFCDSLTIHADDYISCIMGAAIRLYYRGAGTDIASKTCDALPEKAAMGCREFLIKKTGEFGTEQGGMLM